MSAANEESSREAATLSAGLDDQRRARGHSGLWWVGQGVSIYLGIAAIGASESITVGAIVAYALAVLVDIREAVSANVELTGAARLYGAASSDRRERG